MRIMTRHREGGWLMEGTVDGLERMMQTHDASRAQIAINRCHMSEEIRTTHIADDWTPVDMGDMRPIEMRELMQTGIFKRWVEPKEIIVRPDQVSDLMERISKLQEPELQAIRERNRTRAYRDQVPELRHATVISIAA